MTLGKNIILETERLSIRKIIKTDFKNFSKLHTNKDVMKYFDGGAKTMEQSKKKINEIIDHQNVFGFSYYNIFLKSSNEYIGQVGFYYNYDMSINLCYALLTEFQGKGYASEALENVLKYAFDVLNFQEVTLMSLKENEKSIKLAKKMSAIFTGNKILSSGLKVECYTIKKSNFLLLEKNKENKYLESLMNNKYRKAVGGILINKDGKIYLFQRVDFPDNWQGPEGGIDAGELADNAVYREIEEEIGVSKDKLKFIQKTEKYYKYNYIDNKIKNGFIGQEKRFYLFEFLGEEEDFSFENADHHKEFMSFKLCNKNEALKLVIDFKRKIYEDVFDYFDKYIR